MQTPPETPAPKELVIKSISDLQPSVDWLLDHPTQPAVVVWPEDKVVTIILKGETWDGFVDVRVARYVSELQKVHDRLRRECNLESPQDRALVKVRVKEGSTELESKVVDFIKDLTANMTSNQQFVIALSVIGTVFLGWSLKQILQHLTVRQERREAHDREILNTRTLGESLQFAIQKIDPEKPQRTLVGTMGPEDKIKLPGESAALTREEAKAKFPRRPRVVPINARIDDNYHVTSIALEQPTKLTLSKGEVSFRADISPVLDAADRNAFVDRIKTGLENGQSVRMALHVDAKVGQNSVPEALIVGIGRAPRDDAEDILELLD